MKFTSNEAELVPDTGRRRRANLVFLWVLDPQNRQIVLK